MSWDNYAKTTAGFPGSWRRGLSSGCFKEWRAGFWLSSQPATSTSSQKIMQKSTGENTWGQPLISICTSTHTHVYMHSTHTHIHTSAKISEETKTMVIFSPKYPTTPFPWTPKAPTEGILSGTTETNIAPVLRPREHVISIYYIL